MLYGGEWDYDGGGRCDEVECFSDEIDSVAREVQRCDHMHLAHKKAFCISVEEVMCC